MKIKTIKLAKTLYTCSLIALHFTADTMAANVQMTGIKSHENGVAVEWTPTDPGYAYTLQQRISLNGRNWKNVATRYRWPITLTRWTEPGPPSGSSMFYRVISEPILPAERGKLLGSELIRQFSLSQSRSRMLTQNLPTEDAALSTYYYKIIYETVDPFGLPIIASGGLFVPQGVEEALPLLSSQHGTEIYKPWVPSQNDSFWFPQGLFFSASGYVTLMPDYLGLGESPGLHPYLHAKTEASAVVDMLRAVKTFCSENDIQLNDQLFLTGYSQGGHATAAAHREIEAIHADEFMITASAPMAGPFDITGSLEYILTNTDYPNPFNAVFGLSAWLPIYQIADTLEELFIAPYNQKLVSLINGSHKYSEVLENSGSSLQSMLEPGFQDSLMTDAESAFWLAAKDNDLLDWAPKSPTRIYHCEGDDIVPFSNATKALEVFEKNGACCVELIDLSGAQNWNHGDCWIPSLIDAKAWFDGLKR